MGKAKCAKYVVASSWVLAGGSLKTAARACAKSYCGVLDALGFDGYAVAGDFWVKTLEVHHGLQLKRMSTPDIVYRFGRGTEVA